MFYPFLEIAGGFFDLAISGGGFAEEGAGSGDPVFLGVPNRPDMDGPACGLCALESRFRIDQIESWRENLPSDDHAVSFYFNPFNFMDFSQVLDAFH